MARLVQGLRSLIGQGSQLVRLSVPRIANQQRCLHSTRFVGLIVPAINRNVQVCIIYTNFCDYFFYCRLSLGHGIKRIHTKC